MDATYTVPVEEEIQIEFLDRPPLEWGLDVKQYRERLCEKTGTDTIRYTMIKCLMEIDRIIKVVSPLQK